VGSTARVVGGAVVGVAVGGMVASVVAAAVEIGDTGGKVDDGAALDDVLSAQPARKAANGATPVPSTDQRMTSRRLGCGTVAE
jgi:hypothetical protein